MNHYGLIVSFWLLNSLTYRIPKYRNSKTMIKSLNLIKISIQVWHLETRLWANPLSIAQSTRSISIQASTLLTTFSLNRRDSSRTSFSVQTLILIWQDRYGTCLRASTLKPFLPRSFQTLWLTRSYTFQWMILSLLMIIYGRCPNMQKIMRQVGQNRRIRNH
jgi:hypothetical protein